MNSKNSISYNLKFYKKTSEFSLRQRKSSKQRQLVNRLLHALHLALPNVHTVKPAVHTIKGKLVRLIALGPVRRCASSLRLGVVKEGLYTEH